MARAARKRGIDRGFEIAGAVWAHPFAARARGGLVALSGAALAAALVTWKVADPSLNASAGTIPGNVLGGPGAVLSDILFQALGLPAALVALLMVVLGLSRLAGPNPDASRLGLRLRALGGILALSGVAALLAWPRAPSAWPLAGGLGGLAGDGLLGLGGAALGEVGVPFGRGLTAALLGALGLWGLAYALALPKLDVRGALARLVGWMRSRALTSAVRSPTTRLCTFLR